MLDKLRHFFIPHHTNNHKARALHPQAFVFYILLVFVLQISFKTISTNFPDVLGFATDISVDRLLELTNQKRSESGLSPLSFSPTLSQAAANKASDMFSQGYWAHIAPDGKTPWDFITGSGYNYVYAGENLAKSFNDSQSVVDAWMNSSSHKENILKGEYKEIGFAVVNGNLSGEETTLVVQMFGSTNSSANTAQATTVAVITSVPLPTKAEINLPTIIPTTIPIVAKTLPTIISPSPESTIMPTTDIQFTGRSQVKTAGARTAPIININSLTRTFSLLLIGLLLFLLGIDSIFIWKRKTLRVAGHNFAHMLFLIALIGVVYLTGTGVIM
ncbi:hypothetical protein A2773_05145 [Candidatus Gottesmanbacteria bacterium RIFCSPHIGHO2_01_FULL_39_10]|uniref:SCP domain-containing protein n=1 Tax=Candidatus Gottesmanbacteria bacterium RIFCSPHIGHO2_01_FULL_39_10 TaxID=1798375 RepID=A0A1F5ZPQ8_9BACT|nr:MAG: hypothetical protein A2773_05145 [Candidatus Gottesmanbacteria bacterium RIFCSPHIGHO2_01_FULL_39_10]